ncbi:MFS transporter [Actinomadura sp. 3N407]|uniref:MFS transporter n=1 Tax=Actinomadura sp. 3N407 TaxID=3457423 RepID=UPI003FCC3DE2
MFRRAIVLAVVLLSSFTFFSSLAVAAGAIVFVLVPFLVYLPSYLISVVGLDAGEAGLWLLMLAAPTVVLPTAGSALAKRVPRVVLVAGSVAVTGAGALLLVTIGPDSTPAGLAVPLVLTGAGFGLSTGLLDGLAISVVRPEQAGTAAGMFATSRLATETVGIAVVGAMLAALSGGRLEGSAYTGALHTVCLVLAAFAAVATCCVLVLFRGGAGRGPRAAGYKDLEPATRTPDR